MTSLPLPSSSIIISGFHTNTNPYISPFNPSQTSQPNVLNFHNTQTNSKPSKFRQLKSAHSVRSSVSNGALLPRLLISQSGRFERSTVSNQVMPAPELETATSFVGNQHGYNHRKLHWISSFKREKEIIRTYKQAGSTNRFQSGANAVQDTKNQVNLPTKLSRAGVTIGDTCNMKNENQPQSVDFRVNFPSDSPHSKPSTLFTFPDFSSKPLIPLSSPFTSATSQSSYFDPHPRQTLKTLSSNVVHHIATNSECIDGILPSKAHRLSKAEIPPLRSYPKDALIEITCSTDNPENATRNGELVFRRKLPAEIVFYSGTIRHIASSSAEFKEGKTGVIDFPTIPPILMDQVFLYLVWNYYKDSKELKNTIKHFKPRLATTLELMNAALYLDLPGLVEICADAIAANFKELSDFGDTPIPLIRNILNRLDIAELCFAEHILSQPLYNSNSDITKNRKPIDFSAYFRLHFQSFVSKLKYRERICRITSILLHQTKTITARTIRRLTIEHYLRESFSNDENDNKFHDLVDLLELEQNNIESICLYDINMMQKILENLDLRAIDISFDMNCEAWYLLNAYLERKRNRVGKTEMMIEFEGCRLGSIFVQILVHGLMDSELNDTCAPQFYCPNDDIVKSPLTTKLRLKYDKPVHLMVRSALPTAAEVPTQRNCLNGLPENNTNSQPLSKVFPNHLPYTLPTQPPPAPLSASSVSPLCLKFRSTTVSFNAISPSPCQENSNNRYSINPSLAFFATSTSSVLTSLSFTNTKLTTSDLTHLSSFLKRQQCTLSSLTLSNSINDPLLFSYACQILTENITIACLDLSNNIAENFDLNQPENYKPTGDNQPCSFVTAANPSKALSSLVLYSKSIKVLKIGHNALPAFGLKQLLDSVLANRVLEDIDMEGINLGVHLDNFTTGLKHCMHSMANENRVFNIRNLNLKRNKLLPRQINYFLEVLSEFTRDLHLEVLNLSMNYFNDKTIALLSANLKAGFGKLKELHLDGVSETEPESNVLTSSASLACSPTDHPFDIPPTVPFSTFPLMAAHPLVSSSSWINLFQNLNGNLSLARLSLRYHSSITDNEVSELVCILDKCNLQNIDFTGCRISSKGAKCLRKAIGKFKREVVIWLMDNSDVPESECVLWRLRS
ncbi:hypothetical protein BKA69DRAFT_1162958 [Paraphysoderma sedebokerense]|nr:hypothetical protein BKA69DRAFT_1162958 [Paraphysoderma sedebokerense]